MADSGKRLTVSPVAVGIVADAKVTVGQIADALPVDGPDRSSYETELAERKAIPS